MVALHKPFWNRSLAKPDTRASLEVARAACARVRTRHLRVSESWRSPEVVERSLHRLVGALVEVGGIRALF